MNKWQLLKDLHNNGWNAKDITFEKAKEIVFGRYHYCLLDTSNDMFDSVSKIYQVVGNDDKIYYVHMWEDNIERGTYLNGADLWYEVA